MNHVTTTVIAAAGTSEVTNFGSARPNRAYPTILAVYLSSAVAQTTSLVLGESPLVYPGANAVQILAPVSATSRVLGCAPVPMSASTSLAWSLWCTTTGAVTVRVFWTD